MVLGEVCSGAGTVLRAGRSGEGWRTSSHVEDVGLGKKSRSKKLGRAQVPAGGNTEVREAEAVDQAQFFADVHGDSQVGAAHHALRIRGPAHQAYALPCPRSQAGKIFVPARDIAVGRTIGNTSREIELTEVVRLQG